jgi:ectoine hydroxylase-related dioxygenase (phytanoyl-CoA dioxygenase family)
MGFGKTTASAPLFQSVAFLPNKGRVFLDLMAEPRLLDYCAHAFRSVPFYFTQQAATIVRNGAKAQVIHSDQQAWPFHTPFPVLLTTVICLTDFTPEMGSTQFVPGTITGPPPAIGVDEASGQVCNLEPIQPVSANLTAGSLAMWDGRLWHGQGASHCEDQRVVIIQNYAMHMVRAQDDYPAMLHDDVYADLSEEERRLLGFEVHYEYAGRIGPRHAADKRRNTNFAFPYVPELRRGSAARAVAASPLTVSHASEMARNIEEKPR